MRSVMKSTRKMNLIDKLHQAEVLKKIQDTDWEKGSEAPLIVELDTTEVCNLACPGCISEDVVSNKTGFSTERLMSLGQEMIDSGVFAVILIGGGEPLAHPAAGDLIELLGSNGVHIGITTNGTLINKYMDVIAKYSHWTRVSMDAGTDETYHKLRPAKDGSSKFDLVIENMRQLAKIKTGRLGFSYLIRTEEDGFGIESNIHELYTAAKLAKEIGCDYFEPKPSYVWANGSDHYLVIHDRKKMDEAREMIESLNELEDKKFKIVHSINLEYSLNCEQANQPKEYTSCPVAELRTLVTPSGVYVCPYFRGKKHLIVGDVLNQSFQEMWNSPKRHDIMKLVDPSKLCKMHCIRHDSNLEIFKLRENSDGIKPLHEFNRFF